jgi:uncharacterized PurR-regulated membrane protein YhhQ (DUF165 family)
MDDDQHASVEMMVQDAFNLGIERGRVVKPLVWSAFECYWARAVASGSTYMVGNLLNVSVAHHYQQRVEESLGSFSAADEAKAACQAHHEQFVLSTLDTP